MEKLSEKGLLRKQFREIKYSLISKMPLIEEGRKLTEAEGAEWLKLNSFMHRTARELQNIKPEEKSRPLPSILIPTMTIKIKAFIKENCPLYSLRFKK